MVNKLYKPAYQPGTSLINQDGKTIIIVDIIAGQYEYIEMDFPLYKYEFCSEIDRLFRPVVEEPQQKIGELH